MEFDRVFVGLLTLGPNEVVEAVVAARDSDLISGLR